MAGRRPGFMAVGAAGTADLIPIIPNASQFSATPDLVIFDCDGVLIDSELLAVRSDVACLAEEGIEETGEVILDRMAASARAC